MPRNVALAEFLRARRELVRPKDVGLSADGRRRVAGLRREEVTALAGISPDYYLRLEQGRDHEPSMQVVEALARALQLNEVAAEHLRGLARPSVRRPRRAPDGEVKALAAVERLIQSWLRTPAWVCNPTWTSWHRTPWPVRCPPSSRRAETLSMPCSWTRGPGT